MGRNFKDVGASVAALFLRNGTCESRVYGRELLFFNFR